MYLFQIYTSIWRRQLEGGDEYPHSETGSDCQHRFFAV